MCKAFGLGIACAFALACSEAGPSASDEAGADSGATCEGVDTETDPLNCGACGRTCVIPQAVAACAMGQCAIASCADGFFDIDGDPSNGCEQQNACTSDTCTTACGSTGTVACIDGQPGACIAPTEVCNAVDDDCDGACDEDAIAGCRVGVYRSSGNGHLYTTDAAAAASAPFNVESANYFRLYATSVPGAVPVYLCRKSNGKHLVTSSNTCESAGTIVLTLGYWSPTPVCGAVPLYRLYHPPTGNHFYTLNAGERDNAINSLGYLSEGTAAHVWTLP